VHSTDASNGAARAVFCEELRGGCGILGYPREWPEASIYEFRQTQQSAGQWFCFFDIANHFARHAKSLEQERSAKALAYSRPTEFAWTGKFDCGGYTRVLFLKAEPPPSLLRRTVPGTRPRLRGAAPGGGYVRPRWLEPADIDAGYRASQDDGEFDDNSPLVRETLWFCWLPRKLLQQWLSWQEIDPKSFPGLIVMPAERDERGEGSVAPTVFAAQEDAQPNVASNPPEKANARPSGVSKKDREIYEVALKLKPGFAGKRGGKSDAARAVVKEIGANFAGVRRAIHRVLASERKNN
jgi:hypothetical protein